MSSIRSRDATPKASPDDRPRSPGRRFLFGLLAALIPVGFFVAIELGLRLANYGETYPLFIEHPTYSDYLLANPEVIRRYFNDPDDAPTVSIETSFFRKERPPGGLRLVVQGGSSAAGFPYGLGASPAGMLDSRLKRALPDRDIEVISTAMSAVNSYTLLDFADEIVAVEPDAVLIYAGHNEYLGVFGVGSGFLGGQSRLATLGFLTLKDFRLYQLLGDLLTPLLVEKSTAGRSGSMMSRVARERAIPLDSPLYERGVEQFRGNLRALLATYREAGIPAFVATIASNERDQPPFVTRPAPGVDSEARQASVDDGLAALERGDAAAAATAFRAALRLDEGAADAWFGLARALSLAGDYGEAAGAYGRARDADQLRFRAPGLFNDIIRAVAAAEGAVVVDVHGRMLERSENGVIGASLMLEHLHPNLDGYFLMADAFYDAMAAPGGLAGIPAEADDARARRDIPVSDIDRHFGDYKVLRIMADWPFTEAAREPRLPPPTDAASRLAHELYGQRINWAQAHDRLRKEYLRGGNTVGAVQIALILADAFPFLAKSQYDAGAALLATGRAAEAVRYFTRTVALAPGDPNALLGLGASQANAGRPADARRTLGRVLAIDADNAQARQLLQRLENGL